MLSDFNCSTCGRVSDQNLTYPLLNEYGPALA
jgi:hypothetical protein